MQIQPATSIALLLLYRTELAALRRAVQRKNPEVCPGLVDQAVQDTFLHCYRRPGAFNTALAQGGLGGLRKLVYFAAMCKLREYQRRRYYTAELHIDLPEEHVGSDPERDLIAARLLRVGLPALVHDAAVRCGRGMRDAVEGALWMRLFESDSDEEAAQRFNVPRKYVQRARRALEERVLAA
jgi:hypothetical protein